MMGESNLTRLAVEKPQKHLWESREGQVATKKNAAENIEGWTDSSSGVLMNWNEGKQKEKGVGVRGGNSIVSSSHRPNGTVRGTSTTILGGGGEGVPTREHIARRWQGGCLEEKARRHGAVVAFWKTKR